MGLWSGLLGTGLLTSRRYGTGSLRSDFRLELGVVRHLTGRLGSSIATHFFFNATVTAIAILASLGGLR